MPLNYKGATLTDFSGGITDKYINPEPNKAKELRNFILTENGSAKTRPGSKLFFEQDALVRIMRLEDLNGDLLVFRGQQLYIHDAGLGTFTPVLLPTPASPILRYTLDTSYVSSLVWRDQVFLTSEGLTSPLRLNRPVKVFRDDTDTLRGVELGLRPFDETGMLTTFNGDGGYDVSTTPDVSRPEAYLWAFHFSYTYKVGDITYSSNGPVYITPNYYSNYLMGSIADAGNQVEASFNNILSIDPSNSQIDYTNVVLKVFRTVSGGDDFFKVAELPYNAGVQGFTDDTNDQDLVNNEPIYISNGILDTYAAPRCKYMTIVNDIPYYAFIQDETSDEFKPYRVIQGDSGGDTHNPSAFKDVDDEVKGISNVNGFPILFTKSYIYRLEGTYDNIGGGGIRARVISERVGCVSHNSIIRTNNRIFFIGNNGVYITDGYTVDQIPASKTLFDRIREFISDPVRADKITATYDFIEERIYWSVGDNDTENDQWLILNLKTLGFTEADGFNFFSSACIFKDDSLIRGDQDGYLYEHKDGYLNDIVKDLGSPVADWETAHIPWYLETTAADLGSPAVVKWVSSLTTSIKSQSNYAVKPISNNDDERVVKDLKEIRSFGTFFWGDPTFVWGDPEIRWKKQETESHKRHFPRGTMRCRRKQVAYEPAEVIVYNSDNYGLADVVYTDPLEPLDFTVTLQGLKQWPADSKGYFIQFYDAITETYLPKQQILSISGQVITVAGGGLLPGTDKKWEIVGKFKNQEVEFKSVTVKYAPLGNEGNEFKDSDSGGNA